MPLFSDSHNTTVEFRIFTVTTATATTTATIIIIKSPKKHSTTYGKVIKKHPL